jgi:hypothetical protein
LPTFLSPLVFSLPLHHSPNPNQASLCPSTWAVVQPPHLSLILLAPVESPSRASSLSGWPTTFSSLPFPLISNQPNLRAWVVGPSLVDITIASSPTSQSTARPNLSERVAVSSLLASPSSPHLPFSLLPFSFVASPTKFQSISCLPGRAGGPPSSPFFSFVAIESQSTYFDLSQRVVLSLYPLLSFQSNLRHAFSWTTRWPPFSNLPSVPVIAVPLL